MWGSGPGWRSQQRAVEELVRAETRSGPDGAPPRRPRTSTGAAGVLGLVLLVVLYVILIGGPDVQTDVAESPSLPAATLGIEAGTAGAGS